ncbi:LOW QUALITY PROTEIN: F-actin-monooxygenase Mical [Drosophila kikkawai]|uniref:F-actin monooxygenase n=1 Tax=Drosophila kikkawai TaxID=30033 RepID=A0A6P4JJ96_DROKI|nr:LOW QUALITY PROTEIN: F-actin-monooxygenase Mical [Drosophila kikkawai]
MSRQHQRHHHHLPPQQQQQQQQHVPQQQQQLTAQQQLLMAEHAAAAEAAELFDLLCVATTMRQILALHRSMCEAVGLRPSPLNDFYPRLKAKVRSWKAQALWKKFDARAAHRVYGKGAACSGTRVLVIGAGPCGLRTAIEAQLLGAKVVVLEKRDRITRNNVLHLWPFVITDLRNLGAKKFYGKFCAGSIDHISIRQLQCMLLKVALLLGVEIHEGVSFEHALEPSGDSGDGWRAVVTPSDHAVSHYEFDVLIGADGKRNMLDFRRKEFRGKLAIAITANFINKKTEAEAKVEEISGVAFIFNQAFFKELYSRTGIDLENIVYYKDETHYFVMTAKKHSLIDKGVIIEDMADPGELLAQANVDTQKLHDYAREAAEFSTQYQMPNLEFAVNHYGKPDVAMFDFTSMFAAEMSCRVIVRKGARLLQCLVGDSLLEPFWPTGSGCARGFLSSMDAAYAIKLWSNPQNSTLGVLAQRESIYRLLNQTTPDTLQRDISAYTVDPATRYPNLNRESVNSWQVKHLVDTDDPAILEETFMETHALQTPHVGTPGRRKRRSGDLLPQGTSLLRWISAQLMAYQFVPELKEPSDVFRNGRVLCALINRYRPDLIDFAATKDMSPVECNELAFAVLERELHVDRVMSAKQSMQLTDVDSRSWLNYLDQICEVFRGEIPHVKHPKMDFSDLRQKYRINHTHAQPDFSKLLATKPKAKSPMQDAVDVPTTVQRRSVLEEERAKRQRRHEQLLNSGGGGAATGLAASGATAGASQQPGQGDTPRRSKKRRQVDKTANIEERQQRLQEIEENRQERMSKRRQQRYHQTQNFYKSLQLLQAGKLLREGGDGEGVAEDGTPFEDYSIFLYRQQAPVFNDRVKDLERKLLFPDRERGDIPSALPRTADEQFSDRIKNMEQRMTGRGGLGGDKKPKDLMRAIGKIDSSDWNVREIEKKIELSKKTEIHGPKGREKVPKWSKEQFQARQHKMSKPQRQDSREAEKFKDIDQTIRNLDKQLKEGHNLDVGERGRNKVASIAGQFGKKDEANSDEKNAGSSNATTTNTTTNNNTVIPKSSSKVALAFKKQAASEKCRFCKQTVYLMEKTTVEGLVLHRNCLKCHHCHTNLRLGGYAFDRDDPQGRFYCTQHFRLPPKPLPQRTNKARKSAAAQAATSAVTPAAPGTPIAAAAAPTEPMDTTPARDQVDLLETSRANASADAMSDDEANVIDEHEWSDRNFLPESINDSQSELSSSDESDTESDSEFEEADDSPFGAQTLQLASEWIGKQYCGDSDVSDDFYDSSEGIADDGKDDTEGEEFKKARELRREEVRLQPLPANLPTDTETEKLKLNIVDNKENVAADRRSLESANSFESARSQPATPLNTPTRVEMEQLERNAPRKFSSEIEAISEKLYHMNNMVKMNKDLEVLAKENLVKSDILRKLTLKEKWLAENAAIAAGQKVPVPAPTSLAVASSPAPTQPKSKFDEKYEKVVSPPLNVVEPKPKPVIDFNLDELKPRKPNFEERPKEQLPRPAGLKKPPPANPKAGGSTNVSRSNSLKSNASSGSPKVKKAAPNASDKKMQIEGILSTIKKIQRQHSSDLDEDMDMDVDVEAEADNKQLSTKLKEIQASSFAGTMDHIKSQLTMPTVSAQAAPTVDLSKYFPNQKVEKSSTGNTNKNQKTLKDVDLAKYFPSSPAPQRRTVETVAERLKKSQTEASLAKAKGQEDKAKTPTGNAKNPEEEKGVPSPKEAVKVGASATKPVPPKRQASLDTFSLREHQMDGALDLTKKKTPAKTTTVIKKPAKSGSATSLTKATATSKGKTIKIVKKIVPKGTKAKKAAAAAAQETAAAATAVPEKEPPKDEAERILDEILGDGETRSPSSEYQRLFGDEKSPSDLSDNIDRILEETGLDLELGLPKRSSKKLVKTKSLGEGEFDLQPSKERLTGVQNILKRFESMSSVHSQNSQNSDEQAAFKLRRMESTTSNLSSLTRSRESLVSASDSMSDLEKTMDYLRNEWRNEATNFLQKKRDKFYAKKEEQQKKVEQPRPDPMRDLPVQYRDSKLAKFFGLGSRKSPEKRKSPIKKKKSPSKTQKVAKTNNSLEELANISNARQAKQAQKKVPKVVQPKPLKPATPVPDDFEILDLLEKGTEAKLELERSKTKSPAVEQPVKDMPKEAIAEVPLPVEDIKNLPKTGCDKSLNSSRRGSQSSLVMSRRPSEISLNEKLNQDALIALSNLEKEREAEQVDELFQNMVEEMEEAQAQEPQPSALEDDIDADSLCTTISKSPSAQPVTVVKRGSSEDQSIEKLFGHFSDEMLVNVEFDSNDELVGITPRATLVSRDSADRDYLDKLESLERDEDTFQPVVGDKFQQEYGQDEVDSLHFPSRPQRRPKSSSSSSEPSLPVVPQRLKKKLAKLDPEDMAPSVQDLLQQVYAKNSESPAVEVIPVEGARTLRFPSMSVEEYVDEVDNPRDHVVLENGTPPKEVAEPTETQEKENPVEEAHQAVMQTSNQSPVSQNNFLKSENSSESSLVEVPKIITPPKVRSKENSADWDMEKLPASPMPRRRLLQGQTPSQTQSLASKESSLEWDMEKLPSSPMPPRRNNRMRPVSPSNNSVQLLNNLPSDGDDEAAQRRLIEDFERERRQALIKRDENFEATAAEQRRRDSLQSSSNSSSKRSLPPPTPPSKMGSRRGTTQDTNRTQETSTRHEGTPPMFKKLDVDGTATPMDSTTCSTRRSSFAFIELQDNKPVIVPMPKKLKLPKPDQPRFVPEPVAVDEPVPEVFQGRSWPKAQLEGVEGDLEDLDEEEQAEKLKQQLPEYARSDGPPSAAFKNRKWPDGKTVFDQRAESLEEEDVLSGLLGAKRRGSQRFRDKPRSQSPQPFKPLANSSRQSSKSFSDLKKGPSLQSLSAQSSQDTDTLSTTTTVATARPLSYSGFEDPMDASTQALLDRSKRLHNRKRDFVNERVVERNPYMREVLRSTDRRDYDDVDEDLTSYRPRHYTSSTLNRFPSTSTRTKSSSAYDYLSPSSGSDYLSRRPYISSSSHIPSTSAASSSYYPSSARSSHLSDLFRRRSPAGGSGYGSKESCPGLASDRVSQLIESKCTWVRSTKVQTESETSSPDEVELNSATEISTDSEFDNDEIIRQAPKIFIDDTHLRKPTKVQIKSTMIGPNAAAAAAAGLHQKQVAAREKGGSYLPKYQPQPPLPQFKPLVQVDPTLLISSQRAPLQNPRPGDYLLNKTASTEGIASKKSLELKKRYLLGEPANGNKIQKSGSTSVLDSRIRSFQSNISECQKLLNPSSDISAGMRTFLDRTKLGEGSSQSNELMRSATSNVINDLRVELRIQKAPSSHSTDNEKENVFVNCKNELNKGMEYTDAVNATLLDQLARKSSPTTQAANKTVIEVIDLVTPEKPVPIIDLTGNDTPKKQLEADDSNKISELQKEVKEEPKPDVSRDVKECIPDILGHIKETPQQGGGEEQQSLLCQSDEEKRDSPEKEMAEQEPSYEPDSVQIQVPNIPWDKSKPEVMSTTGSSGSICSSSDSSSIEDIQHYILESTTSPDTQTTAGGKHNVPRLEVHDTSGALMQVDSLMIVNGKYIGDPEDVKFLDMPADVIVPSTPALKTSELEPEDDHETEEVEPVTATPEPAECTVIEAERQPPPLPDMGPPTLKFDTKNENKIESLKNLPLIVESSENHSQAVKPITLNLSSLARTPDTPTTPTAHDSDKTPTGEVFSRGSDSETEPTGTGTGQVLTETELSDWTADDCISENFVDMEFVLNSNKGTMKRRKERRRTGGSKLPSGNEVIHELARQAPVVEMDGILSAIDIDDIEFMDTGSEGSCAEAYSATNTALLQNRGYMEYIEAEPKKPTPRAAPPSSYLPPLVTKRDEKLGVDYIEQGAYIMQDDAKTPVNEVAPAMTQSLTDSSTLNELDDDSMAGLGLSQTQPTTTEESEALTVVTSPLDTSSPRVLDQFASMLAAGKGDSTPSSSEQQPKTSTVSSSSGPNSSTPGNASKETVPPEEDLQIQFEYVRALQQRISQISTQRRKSSKGEPPNLTVIEPVEDQPKAAEAAEPMPSMRPRSSSSSSKVPEIPTLSSKLEEITKERTKQKDLIHDLVMDKLQSKKQLNAEKRLHRSRQRSLLTSGYASGASLSPTPKLAAASSPQDSNCSSQAHYHASTAEERPPKPVDERPLQKSATSTYVSPYRTVQGAIRSADRYKPRPFSEHIDANALEGYKLGKTASFNGGKLGEFATPNAPARGVRTGGAGAATADISNISASTENLRSEARARARLKSNTELGLSPEEKMQLLRSRLHYDQARSLKPKQMEELPSGDLAARARKMSASKSVNDLAYMVVGLQNQQQQQQLEQDVVLHAKAADFTSDPNIAAGGEKATKTKSGRRPKDPERRKSLIQSLSSFFQKGSSSASAKEQGSVGAGGHSEQLERPGTSSSSSAGTPTISDAVAAGGGGGGGGVFSRFRISPKSKEKSKSCFDLRSFGFGDKDNMLVCQATAATAGDYLNNSNNSRYRKQTNNTANKPKPESFSSSSPQLYIHKPHQHHHHHHLATAIPRALDDQTPPPIPPLPLNYQRSDDESYANETREHKKQRAISKASRQAELKRLRIAQEIQREQEEIEVQLKELEGRGVHIEKALRGEGQNLENLDSSKDNDEKLLKELLEIWRNITALKKRDEELTIRQQELQLEYRHAQLKEELNLRLSCNKLDKSSADVAAEGAILNEMLEIVAKRAALRPTASQLDLTGAGISSEAATGIKLVGQPLDHDESNI